MPTSESGAVSANRALAYLSGICGWAIEQEYIAGTNLTSDIKPLHEDDRERVLSEEELVETWLAAGDNEFARIVKLDADEATQAENRRARVVENPRWQAPN